MMGATQFTNVKTFNENVTPGQHVGVGFPFRGYRWTGRTQGTAWRDAEGQEYVEVLPDAGAKAMRSAEAVSLRRVWVIHDEDTPGTAPEPDFAGFTGSPLEWNHRYSPMTTVEVQFRNGDRVTTHTCSGAWDSVHGAEVMIMPIGGWALPERVLLSQVRPLQDDTPEFGFDPASSDGDRTAYQSTPIAYAPNILRDALDNIERHRADRDNADTGERTGAHAARIFNAITGRDLTEREAWLVQECFKKARAEVGVRNADPNPDDYIDGAAYTALAGEAALRATKPGPDGEGDASAK